ncbi:MED6 mediator subfamily complex component-domain-containing protein, partial [Lipomyces starkeyi]
PLARAAMGAPEWIQMFGLRTDNVLEYFVQSPFYDRASNNQVLKMQSQFNTPSPGTPRS